MCECVSVAHSTDAMTVTLNSSVLLAHHVSGGATVSLQCGRCIPQQICLYMKHVGRGGHCAQRNSITAQVHSANCHHHRTAASFYRNYYINNITMQMVVRSTCTYVRCTLYERIRTFCPFSMCTMRKCGTSWSFVQT